MNNYVIIVQQDQMFTHDHVPSHILHSVSANSLQVSKSVFMNTLASYILHDIVGNTTKVQTTQGVTMHAAGRVHAPL